MRIPKSDSRVVRFYGYAIFGFGALTTVQYLIAQLWFSIPPNMGIVLGSGAIVLAGLATTLVTNCLGSLEDRVDRLENLRAPPRDHASRT
jgi:hypothetical protein